MIKSLGTLEALAVEFCTPIDIIRYGEHITRHGVIHITSKTTSESRPDILVIITQQNPNFRIVALKAPNSLI
jgi:hypothetical protein